MKIFVMNVEIPFPPPKLNPQEFVNQDVKANFLSGVMDAIIKNLHPVV